MASLDSIMNEDEQQEQMARRPNRKDAESVTASPRPPLSRHPSGHRHRPPSQPEEGLSQDRGQDHITLGHRILPRHLSNDQDQIHHQVSDIASQEAYKTRDILSPQPSIEPCSSSSTVAQPAPRRPAHTSTSTPRSRSKRAIRKPSSSISLSSSLRTARHKRSIRNLGNKRTKETTSPSSTQPQPQPALTIELPSSSRTSDISTIPQAADTPEPAESTDAMDHGPYVQSAHMATFPHMNQEPSTAMRPPYFPSVMDTEFPYPRVTPRTGRLSRAKKGLPVHFCEPCNKWFTRAEHLRRHQLSHDSPQFKCTFDGCDRAFFRKDLLERHVQRHEQEDGTMARSSSGSESPKPRTPRTPRRTSRPHSQSPRPAPYPVVARPPSSTANDIRETVLSYAMATNHRQGSADVQMAPSSMVSSPMGSSTISSSPMGSPHYQSHGRDYGTDAYPPHTMSMMTHYSHPPVPEHMAQQAPRYTGSSVELYALGTSGQLPPSVGMVPSSAADMGARDSWPSSSAMPLGSPAHAVSQPPQNDYPEYYAGHGGSGNRVHSHPQLGSGYYPPLMGMSAMSFPSDQVAMVAPSAGPLYVGSSSSSYANETHEAQTSGVLVPIATCSIPPERAVEPDALAPHGPGPGLDAPRRPGTLALITMRDPSPQVPDTAWAAIPGLIELYWDTVSSLVAIVHPVTFERTHGRSVVLRCAMAVLASQMRGTRQDMVLGVQLYEYAWPLCIEQARTDEPLAPSLLAAISIFELFGRFRARRLERHASEAFKKVYMQTYNSTMADYNNPPPTALPHTESCWIDWVEAETCRRIFALCYVIDVHAAKYFEQPAVLPMDVGAGDVPPVPLACGTAALWESNTAAMWVAIANALGTTPAYVTPALLASITPSSINNYSRSDRFTLLVTYALFPSPVSSGGFASVQMADVQRDTRRFISLYGNCALTNTHLALRYTPLHDLLAISGDTWVYGRKLDAASFAKSQRRLKEWRMSNCAHAATGFAARALVSFLHATTVRLSSVSPVTPGPPSIPSPTTASMPSTPSTPSTPGITVPITFADKNRSRVMTSHHWSMYVCALICWAFGHHARKAAPPPPDPEAAGIRWLREMASSFSAPREQKEARAAHAGCVPGVVRKILETDEEMPFRSWLFVEAVSVLKKLE